MSQRRSEFRQMPTVSLFANNLGFCFVQIIKRIIQWHAPNVVEPGLLAKLADLRFVKTKRAESRAIVCKRRGHAIKHAYAMKHRPEWIRVLLQLVGTVGVETNVNAFQPKCAPNRLQQLKWVDGIVHHVERRDHIKLRR